MKKIAVLGAANGDEGKGHFVHSLSPDYDWVIRTSGGANAGHTIYRDGKKYVHNLLPSVDFRVARTKAFLGSGMVIDLEKLRDEIVTASKDFPNVGSRIYIDPDAFLVLPEHKEEDKKNNGHIGSTNRGIGPAYTAKMGRRGKRIRDLFGKSAEPDFVGQLLELGVQFTSVLDLKDQLSSQSILYEGAQGVLLDLNHGSYPFVSCGDCTVAGIYANGFSFAPPTKVYGVAKAYQTKVGEGPFPTELQGEEAEELRRIGNEYGATTGRPRRVGWLDLPALRYAIDKGGITHLVITKLDILNGLPHVPVCHAYEKHEPVCGQDFFSAKPKLVKVEGWKDAGSLGKTVRSFVKFIESETKIPVEYVSTGTSSKDIYNI